MRQVTNLERRRSQAFRSYGDTWQANSDARKEHRVRKDYDTEKIDDHCGMAEPGKCHVLVTPFPRLGSRKRRVDRPPAFNRPFTKQMREPPPHSGSTWNWLLRCVHPGT